MPVSRFGAGRTRRLSRTKYSRRCAEASAVQALKIAGLRSAPGMEVGYVVADAGRWRSIGGGGIEYDAEYYGKLLGEGLGGGGLCFRP